MQPHHHKLTVGNLLTDGIFVTGVFTGHHLHPSGLQLDCFLDCRQEDTTEVWFVLFSTNESYVYLYLPEH